MEEDGEVHDHGLGVSRLLRKYAPTPFLIYRQRKLPQLQKQNPQAKIADLVKILQVQWKEEDLTSQARIECTLVSDIIRGQLRESLVYSSSITTWLSNTKDSKQMMSVLGVRPQKFDRHLFCFGTNETEQTRNFQNAWTAFSSDHIPSAIPSFAKQKIDLFCLFRSVVSLGGFELVCERQLWDTIVSRQGLDDAATATDKGAIVVLQTAYFRFLLSMELQYQHGQTVDIPEVSSSPVDPLTSLPIANFSPSNFSNNYYRQPGMTAILFSLRSRHRPCVLWALNQLLFISYNQNRPVLFNENPALLEILVALLERQLLVIDLSCLDSRSSRTSLSQLASDNQVNNHAITFPNITPALLVIIKNLSFIAANQLRIAQHHSCPSDLLDEAFKYDTAADTLLLVGQYLDISKFNFTSLSRWLHKCLLDLDDEEGIIRALEFLGTLTLNTVNHNLLASQMHIEVYHLLVALLSFPSNDDVVLAALEAFARLSATGGAPFAVRIVAQTDCIDKLVNLLSSGPRAKELDDIVMRRTVSTIISDLYVPEENRMRFRPFFGTIFKSIGQSYEASTILAPILRASIFATLGR
uniref:ARID domain-containing protein n=1 Tax=Spongospora subterranea TaxID=70186 RepID=A0A0H5R760_9EUKA|eukprot:CRZ09970.1 hypothetical protein [Spongospora subterranea]